MESRFKAFGLSVKVVNTSSLPVYKNYIITTLLCIFETLLCQFFLKLHSRVVHGMKMYVVCLFLVFVAFFHFVKLDIFDPMQCVTVHNLSYSLCRFLYFAGAFIITYFIF